MSTALCRPLNMSGMLAGAARPQLRMATPTLTFGPRCFQLKQSLRFVQSRSERNKSTRFIGKHKEPRTDEQRLRSHGKHKPFVLGRDNVKRIDEPISIPPIPPNTEANRQPGSGNGKGWTVLRTSTGCLPVYTEYRNGRSRILTVVRRIGGDVDALASDLSAILPSSHAVQVKQPQNHVVIKGNVQRTVRYWMNAIGL